MKKFLSLFAAGSIALSLTAVTVAAANARQMSADGDTGAASCARFDGSNLERCLRTQRKLTTSVRETVQNSVRNILRRKTPSSSSSSSSSSSATTRPLSCRQQIVQRARAACADKQGLEKARCLRDVHRKWGVLQRQMAKDARVACADKRGTERARCLRDMRAQCPADSSSSSSVSSASSVSSSSVSSASSSSTSVSSAASSSVSSSASSAASSNSSENSSSSSAQ